MSAATGTFVVEYPCDRHCRAEFDLADVHPRFTHAQMLRAVGAQHDKLHEDGGSARLEVTDTRGLITVVGLPAPAGPLGVGGRGD